MGILPLPYSERIDAINDLVDGFIKLDGGMPQAVTLANIAVSGSASDLTSGTLADARLSSNVPLKNAANTFTGANTFNGSTTLASSSFVQRPDGNILLGWDSGGDYLAAGSNAGTARPLGIGANHTQISIRTGGVTRTKIFGNGNFQIGDNADNGALLQVLGTSNITGAAQFGSTLNVTGAATFSGVLTASSGLLVSADDSAITGGLTVNGVTIFNGNQLLSGTLTTHTTGVGGVNLVRGGANTGFIEWYKGSTNLRQGYMVIS